PSSANSAACDAPWPRAAHEIGATFPLSRSLISLLRQNVGRGHYTPNVRIGCIVRAEGAEFAKSRAQRRTRRAACAVTQTSVAGLGLRAPSARRCQGSDAGPAVAGRPRAAQRQRPPALAQATMWSTPQKASGTR